MPVEIIAHRGASIECHENTLQAFRVAMQIGADYLECDVHLSKDGVPVVVHDFDVEGKKIVEQTREELKKYQIPTLKEVLALGHPVMVELKPEDRTLVKDAIALCEGSDVVIGSLNAQVMEWLEVDAEGFTRIEVADHMGLVTGHSDLVGINDEGLTKAFVEQLKEDGHTVWVWAVDDFERAKDLIDWGVDGIITNDPRKMQEL
ncbi:MAG: hypothetical protein SP1CHLAM54_07910 [Chlamydiia bacterium]|nr:hypothetical protein [Chlamydiia bacterium]MCH9615697.1 hypothetical protein [Chlamydiia bacterium]MCH9628900.1 hypothetical protein [Chlamydiia bacterium]